MQVIGGTSIVLWPLLVGISDEVRMAAEPPQSGTLIDTEYGVESILAGLDVIEDHRGLFVLAGGLSYAATLVMVVALLAIWQLSVARSPRWAWAGAILAGLGALGLMVHFTGYYGGTLAALDAADQTAAAEFMLASEQTGLMIAFFTPFFFTLIAPIPQAVGLWRARVLPLWAMITVIVGAVVLAFVGSTPWSAALTAVLFIAGFSPAALALLRGRVDDSRPVDAPVTQPATA
jgi:hypothetical protein